MENFDIPDPLFKRAVEAIDNGNLPLLEELLSRHPQLVRDRAAVPVDGYFKNPYLLWFVADNPIRTEKLAPNIVAVTDLLIRTAKREAPETFSHQLDYTLGLVATGRIPRECGVQIQLMDLLIDAGATPGGGVGAIAHGNLDAAAHLIKRGGKLSLGVAVCLDLMDDIDRMLPAATDDEKLTALTAAAFWGKTALVKKLIPLVADINTYPNRNSGFHSHATPLHQAICSGSLDTVKELVNAGARLDMPDKIYEGTQLGWAEYMLKEETDPERRKKMEIIRDYLRKQVKG